MQLQKTTKEDSVIFRTGHNNRIAVKNIDIDVFLPYCDPDNNAVVSESFRLPLCETQDDFLEAVQNVKMMDISLQEDYFICKPRFEEDGILGMYQNTSKKIILLKNGSQYEIRDFIESDIFSAGTVGFFGGSSRGAYGDFSISGTKTVTNLLQSSAFSLQSDLTISGKTIQTFEKTAFEYNSAAKKKSEIHFYKNGRVSADLIQEIRIQVDQIIDLPFFGFCKQHTLDSFQNDEIKKIVQFGFSVRGGDNIERKNYEHFADLPLATDSLRFKKQADGKVWLYAWVGDTETLIAKSLLACNKLCIIADNTIINAPITVTKNDSVDRNGVFCFAYSSSTSADYTILTSPKFEISIVADKLRINGYDTVTIPQQKNLIVAIQKNAGVVVDVLNLTDSTNATHTNTAVTWTDTTQLDSNIVWANGITIGPFIQTIEDNDERALQWIKSEVLGSPAKSILGTYAAPDFGNGATLEAETLTVGTETFTKVKLKISSQMQKILRMQSPIQKYTKGDFPAYTKRVQSVEVHGTGVQGVNGTSLLCRITPNEEQNYPVFHNLTRDKIEVSYKLVDSQGQGPISKKIATNQKWTVSLVAE